MLRVPTHVLPHIGYCTYGFDKQKKAKKPQKTTTSQTTIKKAKSVCQGIESVNLRR